MSDRNLISRQSVAGLWARKGFRFQDQWILYNLVGWLSDSLFRGFVNEGADDVDVFWYSSPSKSGFYSERYQLKDRNLDSRTVDEILTGFERAQQRNMGSWTRFHVVSTRCALGIEGLPATLTRMRDMRVAYLESSVEYRAAAAAFKEQLKDPKINASPEFLVNYVQLDFAAAWILNADSYWKGFHGLLMSIGVDEEKVADAAAALLHMITTTHVGKLVDVNLVEGELNRYRKDKTAKTDHLRSAPRVTGTPSFAGGERRVDSLFCRVAIFPGEATILQFSGGCCGLLDCGPKAAREVIRYLAERGISELSFIAVSHLHYDHFSGISAVLSALDHVDELRIPVSMLRVDSGARHMPQVQRLMHQIQSRGLKVVDAVGHTPVHTVYDSNGDAAASLIAYGPSPVEIIQLPARNPDRNASCVVHRLAVGKTVALFPADAIASTWDGLLSGPHAVKDSLNAQLLVLSRHGSRSSLTSEIISSITRREGFVGVVEPLRIYGLPHENVLEAVRKAGGEIMVCQESILHFAVHTDGVYSKRTSSLRAPSVPTDTLATDTQ